MSVYLKTILHVTKHMIRTSGLRKRYLYTTDDCLVHDHATVVHLTPYLIVL